MAKRDRVTIRVVREERVNGATIQIWQHPGSATYYVRSWSDGSDSSSRHGIGYDQLADAERVFQIAVAGWRGF